MERHYEQVLQAEIERLRRDIENANKTIQNYNKLLFKLTGYRETEERLRFVSFAEANGLCTYEDGQLTRKPEYGIAELAWLTRAQL